MGGQAPSPAYLGQKDWPAPSPSHTPTPLPLSFTLLPLLSWAPSPPPTPTPPPPHPYPPPHPTPPQNISPHLGLFMVGKSNQSTLGFCSGCADVLRVMAPSLNKTQESRLIV